MADCSHPARLNKRQPSASRNHDQKLSRLKPCASARHGLSGGSCTSSGSTLVSISDSNDVCGFMVAMPTSATTTASRPGMLDQLIRLRPFLNETLPPVTLPASIRYSAYRQYTTAIITAALPAPI